MIPLIEHHRDAFADLCRRHRVARLEVFGSAAQHDADCEARDIDMIVTFEPGIDLGPWMQHYFALRDELEALLGQSVDLVMAGALSDPHFIREANRTRTPLYAA